MFPVKLVRAGFRRTPTRAFSASIRHQNGPSAAHKPRLQVLQESSTDLFPRLSLGANIISPHEFIGRFGKLEPSQSARENDVQLCGRISRIRTAGSKLVFIDLQQGTSTVQTLCSFKDLEHGLEKADFKKSFGTLQRGDVLEVVGQPQRTQTGELSLRLLQLPRLLSPCLHPVPNALQDDETRMRKRHVDLRTNKRLSSVVYTRAAILQHIRDFLLADGQIEVQTPIMADGASGATARSFTTSATEFPERNINLRIAPELWLKRLIVGGLDRVFEIGPVFRNEGLDLTHNPEFTTCEFYRSYTDLENLLQMTESLMSGLADRVKTLEQDLNLDLEFPDINFRGPYKRLDFIPDIESRAKCKLPDLTKSDAASDVRQILDDRSIRYLQSNNLPQLLDRLGAHYLEPECNEPTWIINHPECMSPLAKSFIHDQVGQAVSARGELFIDGKELANTYEEENSPVEQRRKFEQQLAYRNDENEAYVDESYIEALEWGMPPTGGWGCGIDRLCMLLTGSKRIHDVLTFGNLRNVVNLRQPESK